MKYFNTILSRIFNVNEFMLRFALVGAQTIEDVKSKLYSPASEALRAAVIRVTDESHVWEFNGIVPGTFTSILNSYPEGTFAQVKSVYGKFEKVFAESNYIPELGHAQVGITVRDSEGMVINDVKPCWTGKRFYRNIDGVYAEIEERNLYRVTSIGDGESKVEATHSRPAMSFYGDCFICASTWADGSLRRCEQAIQDTKEAQIEACYKQKAISDKHKAPMYKIAKENGFDRIGLMFALNEELSKVSPLRQAKVAYRKLKLQLDDINFALDYVEGNLSAEVKSANKNAVATVLKSNIGQAYKGGKILDAKWASKDLKKKQIVVASQIATAEALIKNLV